MVPSRSAGTPTVSVVPWDMTAKQTSCAFHYLEARTGHERKAGAERAEPIRCTL